MNKNEDFLYLHYPLPADIARRKAMGDLEGAIRLIDLRLEKDGPDGLLSPRLRAERARLERLPGDYPFTREQALAVIRAEWPDCSEETFDRLVDGGRIDWRCIDGQVRYHEDFLDCTRLYPREAPGLLPDNDDHTARDQALARMEEEGSLSAEITLHASIRTAEPSVGRLVQAWLPVPAACPQQSQIEILEATPGGELAPADAHQRTIHWACQDRDSFEVTYRYHIKADYVDPLTLPCDEEQPTFDTGEQLPHINFTPYLRALAAQITADCRTPVEKAAAIYRYVTGEVDYRYQPAYLQLDIIPESCALEKRGDCGVMALLFITLCRICGIPAKWQSGLSVSPDHVGPHDWAMFYIAPHGWLWADCSFGSSSRRNGESRRRAHYFGSLDPWRMVANDTFQAPLTPPDLSLRYDPYDNQRGEMSVDGQGLNWSQMKRKVELVEFRLL